MEKALFGIHSNVYHANCKHFFFGVHNFHISNMYPSYSLVPCQTHQIKPNFIDMVAYEHARRHSHATSLKWLCNSLLTTRTTTIKWIQQKRSQTIFIACMLDANLGSLTLAPINSKSKSNHKAWFWARPKPNTLHSAWAWKNERKTIAMTTMIIRWRRWHIRWHHNAVWWWIAAIVA